MVGFEIISKIQGSNSQLHILYKMEFKRLWARCPFGKTENVLIQAEDREE
jgi:hypothetical protein